MTKAKLGAGDVEMELDGETVTLRPTLKAARAISSQAGGISGAVEAVGKLDLDAVIGIVTLGLGLTGQEAREIPEKVWRTGLTELVDPVLQYLMILANGGRPIEDGGEEEADPR